MSVLDQIYRDACLDPARVVLPEAGLDTRVLKAARLCITHGWAKPLLLGNRLSITALASEAEVSLEGLEILNPRDSSLLVEFSEVYRELRHKEGLSSHESWQRVLDPLTFGALMVRQGVADGMTAGVQYASGEVIRAGLHCVGLRENCGTLSSFFIMVIPDCSLGHDGVLFFADCSVVPDPDERQLADIGISTARSVEELLGIEAKLAFLSYSTRGSSSSHQVNKVVEAVKRARTMAPGLKMEGELQADAAIVRAVADLKAPESHIAGRANVLIFPDLNSGNISYKLVERLARAKAIGPVLQGLNRPVNDVSRGASVEDLAGTIAITSLQARRVPSYSTL